MSIAERCPYCARDRHVGPKAGFDRIVRHETVPCHGITAKEDRRERAVDRDERLIAALDRFTTIADRVLKLLVTK